MKNVTLKMLVLVFSVFFVGNVNGQDMIDLTGIDNPNILSDTLPDIADGSVVLLQPGMVYNAGFAFDKSVTLKSSDPSNVDMPKIDCASNFNFADGAMVDSIIFMDIEIFGEYDARYVLNSNVAATIGTLRFDGCYIHDLRGVLRMKDAGPGTIDNYTINSCVITMIRDYALLTVDRNDWMVNNILIKNSTISKVRSFLVSKNNSSSVVIDGCTLNDVTASGREMFRWRESGQDNVTEGITIKNTIWGSGWDEEGGGTAIDGFAGLGETTWMVENTYATAELNFAEGKDTIFALLENVYDGFASDLWMDAANGDFHFYDTEFAGIGTAGDPRWAPEATETGTVWNMSDEAFNALGDMVTTSTVEGLTIYAIDGKNVTVDESSKTVDEMSFTHRIKFNGSAAFDDNGLPTGRVLAFDVTGNTKITIVSTSASSSSDRVLNVAAGSNANVLTEIPALAGVVAANEYTYVGEATTILLYSPNSGVNIYYIKAEPTTVTSATVIDATANHVNIYPNPATDKVHVDFDRPIQVGIYNIAGSLMKTKMIQSKNDYISIGDLQPGMYLIRSQNENAFAKKLIKR